MRNILKYCLVILLIVTLVTFGVRDVDAFKLKALPESSVKPPFWYNFYMLLKSRNWNRWASRFTKCQEYEATEAARAKALEEAAAAAARRAAEDARVARDIMNAQEEHLQMLDSSMIKLTTSETDKDYKELSELLKQKGNLEQLTTLYRDMAYRSRLVKIEQMPGDPELKDIIIHKIMLNFLQKFFEIIQEPITTESSFTQANDKLCDKAAMIAPFLHGDEKLKLIRDEEKKYKLFTEDEIIAAYKRISGVTFVENGINGAMDSFRKSSAFKELQASRQQVAATGEKLLGHMNTRATALAEKVAASKLALAEKAAIAKEVAAQKATALAKQVGASYLAEKAATAKEVAAQKVQQRFAWMTDLAKQYAESIPAQV